MGKVDGVSLNAWHRRIWTAQKGIGITGRDGSLSDRRADLRLLNYWPLPNRNLDSRQSLA
jgi:hypothetical protein